jgi:predicted  nucleic acid-binding Zn-ribbon protein
MKICTRCGTVFDVSKYPGSWCRSCKLEYQKSHYQKNKKRIRAQQDQYKQDNYQKILKQKKTYRDANKEKIKKYRKAWRLKHKDSIAKKKRKYRETYMKNPVNKLASNIRGRVKRAISCNYKKGSWKKYLGCSVQECKDYLESLFKPGMTWDNHGEWHIDHIKPISSFDLTDENELKSAFNYKNLQPLWAIENLTKGAKY